MKKIGIVIALISVVLIGIIYYRINQPIDETKAKYIETIVARNDEVSEISWQNDHKWLLIKQKEYNQKPYYEGTTLIKYEKGKDVVGKKYYFSNEWSVTTNVKTQEKKVNKVEVIIYRIKETSLEEWKTLDLIKLGKENKLKGEPGTVFGTVLDDQFVRYRMTDNVNNTSKVYYIRISDEKVFTLEEMRAKYPKERDDENYTYAYETDLHLYTNFDSRKVIIDGGVSYRTNLPHVIFSIDKKRKFGAKKSLLFEKYPEVEKASKKMKNDEWLYLHCLEDPPDVKEIMQLMIPKGEDPFKYGEEVIYDKGDSVEGEDLGKTVLHSFEEFTKEHEAKIIREDEIDRLKNLEKEQEDTAYDE